jgi:integrase
MSVRSEQDVSKALQFPSTDPHAGSNSGPLLRVSPCGDTLLPATSIRRRGKSMNRRVGQNGSVFVKPNCKLGRCQHRKSLCPKYGRYWKDVSGQQERKRIVISFGEVTQSVAERKLREHILRTDVDSVETFNEVTSPATTFKQQAAWWLREIREGRIVSRKRRTRLKPATLANYESAINWLNPVLGGLPLADIKNERAKLLVIRMRNASLSDKTMVNYFQVVRSVVASAVSSEGEQIYPHAWNFQFIGLPIVDERKQTKASFTASEVEQILQRAKLRYRVLFALLAGTGLRIGEALGLRITDFKDDFSTLTVNQSVWRLQTQTPKTANALREVDLPSSLAAYVKAYAGNRKSGLLFESGSGKPLNQRNVLRDGLGKIRRDLKLEQDGKGFHAFRRFRTAHLRRNRVPWDLEKLWLGHANRDVTDKYAEQLKNDLDWRKDVAEKTGLGFALPTSESSVGLLGLPEQEKTEVQKAA